MLKLARFLKPYVWPLAASLVLIFAQTMTDLKLPNMMASIVNEGVMAGDTDAILKTGLSMLLVAAFGAACSILASYLGSRLAMGVGRDLREAVFAKVQAFSLDEFDKLGASTLITRATNDITQVQMFLVMSLRMMVMAPIMMVGGVIMALREDAGLTWVLAVALPFLVVFIALVARRAIPLFKAMQTKVDRVNLVLREKLSGIRVVRAFDREAMEGARFERANRDLADNYVRVNRIMAFMMPALMLSMNVVQAAILWFGMIRIDTGGMGLGSLMAFTQYAMQIMFSLLMVSMMFIMLPRAAAAGERAAEVLGIEPGIADPPKADAPKADAQENDPGAQARRGRVSFKNVSFRYHGAESPALEGVSFEAGPGEVTAIVGSTGSGKSTLLKLLLRFYDVESGSVSVDGRDVRSMSQEDLRRKMGYVPQQAFLFTGTVADNLRVGKPDATDGELARASAISQAADFVDASTEGYGRPVSQGGANLSGGQRQRLSIARAVIRSPEIYLFDDSFSALDFKTDAALRRALDAEVRDATVIIVAQRVGTVMSADRIIVLEEGRIVGMGRHEELLGTCDVYREIAQSQLSEEATA